MNESDFKKYIEQRYNHQVRWYDSKSVLNKRLNFAFQIPTIIMAALVPIFAVLEQQWVTVVLSALVAVFIGIWNLCKFEEQWHNYRSTCEALKRELFFYNAKINGYKEASEPEELFVQRVESIICGEHEKWMAIEMTKKKQSG
jgi:hypothetical protein